MRLYKVYESQSFMNYTGIALIGADSAEEANDYIREFKEYDSSNEMNSLGMRFVDSTDEVKELRSIQNGIILNEISYIG